MTAATVVASFGRQYLVETPQHELLTCYPRGKKSEVACGDRVEIAVTGSGQGVIEKVLPRSTLFYRSDPYRKKLIAANITQIVAVVAAVPSFYEDLLNRCLLAAEQQGIRALLVLNKCDLPQSAEVLDKLQLYRGLGYPLVQLAAKRDVAPLRAVLENQTSALVGQSGVGKSTIINALLPDAQVATAEISQALDSGKHTTTHARLYHLDANSHIIDSPGMQEFGLHHLDAGEIERGFVELHPYLCHCKFRNCLHLGEPGCAVLAALAAGAIAPQRYDSYRRLVTASTVKR
ncbi:MAG: ribosome small subunit-dependent GTPase A [Pseudomonadota bacterium]